MATVARDGGIARTADVAAKLGVSADYGQQYRKRLIDAGVIEAAQRGEARLAMPYLEQYLKAGPY